MHIHRYLATLLVVPALTLAQLPFSHNPQPDLNHKLAMYAKPSVVRIISGCYGKYYYYPTSENYPFTIHFGLGSGYFINPDGYIATNSHVVKMPETIKTEELCRKRLFNNLVKKARKVTGSNLSEENVSRQSELVDFNYFHHVILPKADADPLLPFEVKNPGKPVVEGGKDVAIIKIEVKNAPVLKLGDSNQVQFQDHIITLGYPAVVDIDIGDTSILSEKSIFEASVTEGRVSNPNKKLKDGSPVLQIDVLAGEGSSGGPVLNDKGEVIGMITFGRVAKGISVPFAIRTSTIWEFIRQAGATNEEGVTDHLYRSGLKLFWQGDYEGAKAKFQAVKGLFPQHSEADRLIHKCEQKIAEEWEQNRYILWLALIAGIGAFFSLAYFLLQRQSSPKKTPDLPTGVATGEEYQGNGTRTKIYLQLENQNQTRPFQLHKNIHKLGRDPTWSDLTVSNNWEVISRRHATLEKDGEDYRIYDGDRINPSRNGLFINEDNRVDTQKGYLLRDGDQLTIGKDPHEKITLIYFNSASSKPAAETTRMA
ncbi:MAG: FHA domain-containing protein [Symploca sp. SIO3C6]|uniref:FHA domain-containing protein n=1 Tax=Symploca sp. SIO1C4 TaxID=2607765 RepID=A0A6B3NBA6_9CYAN|nr:FHA domain-containing protein [Symploca sp. SIO3C6]NER27304.1 FHA domain-containing protein [Symploca sp. SIO1C4]